jgi:hypothetical protein
MEQNILTSFVALGSLRLGRDFLNESDIQPEDPISSLEKAFSDLT